MLIRFPRTFRLNSAPITVSITDQDVTELLGELPGDVEYFEDSVAVSFDSPRAAAEFVENLDGGVPYLASEMALDEEVLFNSLLSEQGLAPGQGSATSEAPRPSGVSVAALAVAISGTAIAIAGVVLGIIGIAL